MKVLLPFQPVGHMHANIATFIGDIGFLQKKILFKIKIKTKGK